MATISAFPALQCIFNSNFHRRPSPILPVRSTHLPTHAAPSFKQLSLTTNTNRFRGMRRVRSAEEETLNPEEEEPLLVSISPSLTMLFLAEGTMNETAVPTVKTALEKLEGLEYLTVGISEGIASVELIKKTTGKAGVASSLVELIQSKGFKLQTLSLSFEEEEEENLVPA